MSITTGLRLVKFKNKKTEKEGFIELVKTGRQTIRKIEDQTYIISRQQCTLLTDKEIKYEILKKL